MCSGDIDPQEAVKSAENLKGTLYALTGRDDLRLGEVAYVTDYRSVVLVPYPHRNSMIHLRSDRPSVRMVNQYGKGRIFVAGDAAHVHTPRGGQVCRRVASSVGCCLT